MKFVKGTVKEGVTVEMDDGTYVYIFKGCLSGKTVINITTPNSQNIEEIGCPIRILYDHNKLKPE